MEKTPMSECKQHHWPNEEGPCPYCEIERLRETLDKYKKILEKNIDTIFEKNRRIEELEKAVDYEFPITCEDHHITTAQIDAAVADAAQWPRRFGWSSAMWGLLGKLGIVRCGVCGGEEMSVEWGEGGLICSLCDGHRWVAKNAI